MNSVPGAQASACRGNTSTQQAESCAPRAAFTLVELLVVIGIMMLLMGLVLGSVTRGPRLQGMIAAEQMVADVVRQARHTARTSGQPVVLQLRKDERQIGGLTRQILWQGLEGWPTVHDGGTPGVQLDAPGRTGTALMLPEAYHLDGVTAAPLDLAGPERIPLAAISPLSARLPLTGGYRVFRGQASPDPRPTLLLSVAVLPPTAVIGGPDLLPLALVAAHDDHDKPGNLATAPIGLMLVLSTNVGGPNHAPEATKGLLKSTPTWEILGWCGVEPERVEISSISHAPPDQAGRRAADAPTLIIKGTASGDVSEYSEPWALIGGRWTEISLLAEAGRLVLYRDGRRIAERPMPDPPPFPVLPAERVYPGIAYLPDSGMIFLAKFCMIDDVRLERLGDALAGMLPGGVVPDQDRRITCHPDGRVEVDAPGDAAAADIGTITLVSNGNETAELTITTAGAVTSRTLAGAEP